MSRLPYPDKPKPRGGVPLSTFGLLFFMVVLGIMIGGSAMLASAPTLFNHRATQDYFSTLQAWVGLREASIAATQAAIAHEFNRLENAATQQAINLDATAVALGSDAALLRQTATQLTNFAQATATANAAQTNRQMTQVALDFVATQSQIDQIATQAALNFAATMAAFGTPEAALPAQSLSLAAPPTQPALPFDSSPTAPPRRAARPHRLLRRHSSASLADKRQRRLGAVPAWDRGTAGGQRMAAGTRACQRAGRNRL